MVVTDTDIELENKDMVAEENDSLDVISQGEADYEEIIDNNEHGEIIGNCKWFNKKLGYGFITVYTGPRRGVNIFVHHTGIKPLNSNFRTLRKGEYVHFNIVDGQNGLQATDVTGIMGGPLMCDNVESRHGSYDDLKAPRSFGRAHSMSDDDLHMYDLQNLANMIKQQQHQQYHHQQMRQSASCRAPTPSQHSQPVSRSTSQSQQSQQISVDISQSISLGC